MSRQRRLSPIFSYHLCFRWLKCPETESRIQIHLQEPLHLERIRAQLSQQYTFKKLWDHLKTLCKSDRPSSCTQVFTKNRRLKHAVTHAGFGTVADSRKSSKICHRNMNVFATWVDLRRWKKKKNPCKPDTFHLEWNSAFLHFTFNRNYHDKKCQWPIW